MKDTYKNLQVLMGGEDHHVEHQWKVCANLNVVPMLCCNVNTLNSAALIVNGRAERGTATTE